MTFEFALLNHKLPEFFKGLQNQQEVQENINKLDVAYYDGKPLIPDSTYDLIRNYCNMRFPELKKKVGKSGSNRVWPEEALEIPMGSLDKASFAEKEKFDRMLAKHTQGVVVASNKVDGLSLEITYENGLLVKAITRGDGVKGDNRTSIAFKTQIPKKIKSLVKTNIRAELICTKKEFSEFLLPRGYKNARNSAAGIFNRLDGQHCEYLSIVAFDITDDIHYKTKMDKFKKLADLGFNTPNPVLVRVEDIYKVLEYIENKRNDIPYLIDGVVVEENDLEFAEEQGVVDNCPKASIAYKFVNESATATLLDVKWQVGKIGTITPVGIISPTEIQGITINRVMLNNLSFIKERGLELGSEFKLVRANDVIPYAEEVLTKTGKPILPPVKCPSCDSVLDRSDEKRILCVNHDYCPSQGAYRIVSFLDNLNVKGLAEKTVEKLMDAGLIKDPADLYTLDIEKASQIEDISETVLKKVLKDLFLKSQKVSLPTFIKSLSIPNIGESATEKVMSIYPDLDSLLGLEIEKIITIDGIGDSIATDFFLGLKTRRSLIDRLRPYITITKVADGPLKDKVFCFTGFRSPELEEKIKDLGGSISASVTKVTTHLVCLSTASMTTKAQKAKKDGKEVISKVELEEMLNGVE